MNLALDKRIKQPDYGLIVKHIYAASLLRASTSARAAAPANLFDDLHVVGERWVKKIDRAGYVIHGRLDDLVPVAAAQPAPHPDAVDPRAQVRTAATTTAELLLEIQRGRHQIARLEADAEAQRLKRKHLKRKLRKAATS